MDYVSDLLTRLQKGETVEELASQLTKDINAANKQYEAEQAAKKKDSKSRENKKDAVDALLNALYDLAYYYGASDEILTEIDLLKTEDVVDLLDELVPYFQKMSELNTALTAALQSKCGDDSSAKTKTKATDDCDAAIKQFLKQFH